MSSDLLIDRLLQLCPQLEKTERTARSTKYWMHVGRLRDRLGGGEVAFAVPMDAEKGDVGWVYLEDLDSPEASRWCATEAQMLPSPFYGSDKVVGYKVGNEYMEVVFIVGHSGMYDFDPDTNSRESVRYETTAYFGDKTTRVEISADLFAALNAVKEARDDKYTSTELKESLVHIPHEAEKVQFGSVTRLRANDSLDATAAPEITPAFSNPHLYGYTQLKGPDALAAAIVKEMPPALRRVEVDSIDSLQALIEAASTSPYLEEIIVACSLSIDTVVALFKHAHRDDDPHAGCILRFSNSEVPLVLRRAVPLKTVVDSLNLPPPPTEGDDTVVVELDGVDSPPLRRDRLRFSGLLQKLCSGSGEKRIQVPASEKRFTDVDVALAVLWLNQYACDEVHAMLTETPTAYFISLQGKCYFDVHLRKPGGEVDQGLLLQRCVSLLCAADFLDIPTLKSLLLSMLASPELESVAQNALTPRE